MHILVGKLQLQLQENDIGVVNLRINLNAIIFYV